MTHRTRRWLGPALVAGTLGTLGARGLAQEPAGPSAAARQIHESLQAQVAALNAEDPDAVMALFHPEAPGLEESRRSLIGLFRARDLQYTLEQFKFVAEDGPYAYARCLQSTHDAARGPNSARRLEQLFVFRRANGGWKFWTSAVLRDAAG